MKRSWLLGQTILLLLIIPALACGPAAMQVTPTPTKTPKRVQTVAPLETAVPAAIVLPTFTPTPEVTPTFTPSPVPPTNTPTPVPPTDTPTPTPPPTNTPPPPPPPTNTPPPPPPTPVPAQPQPPAPPPEPPSSKPQIIIELPDGNTHDQEEEFKVIFIVRDPDGVSEFSWGVFTQNQTGLGGGDIDCRNAVECRHEEELETPPISGIFIIGVDALDATGQMERGISELYVR